MGKNNIILYATTNPGKLHEVQTVCDHHGIEVSGPGSLGLSLVVQETGQSLQENARLKAEAYLPVVGDNVIVMTDDTGLEIDALGGEPGITVRRWKGYEMTDDEIIDYALERLKGVPSGQRGAVFHTVLAVGKRGSPLQFFHGRFRGEIMTEPRTERVAGMPFFPLFYIPELRMSLGEFHELPIEKQLTTPTHRELAALAAVPYLRRLIGR